MSGAASAPGGDPSMEDILASIRKILNEEEASPTDGSPDDAAARRAGSGTELASEPETLELTEAMLVATPAAEVDSAPVETSAEPETVPEMMARAENPAQPVSALEPAQAQGAPTLEAALRATEGGLVAPATEAAAVALLGQLARSVAAERAAPVHRGGPTIEDVVREEVRPILKAWMDEHLPPLVERLVRAEIERVASRSHG
ncbi:DUF2497 domain-containing protein [Roseomonas sp. WA12]